MLYGGYGDLEKANLSFWLAQPDPVINYRNSMVLYQNLEHISGIK